MSDFTFNCPHCQQALEVTEEMLGKDVDCPSCGGRIQLQAPEPPKPIPEKEAKAGEASTVETNTGKQGKPEKKNTPCADRSAATDELKRRQSVLPPVKSAYVPSGRMPPGAMPLMIMGAVAGIPGGLVAGVAVLVAGALLASLFGAIFVGIAKACKVWMCCPVIIMLLTALITYAGMYCAIGIACSYLVTHLGEKKRNRNAAAASGLAALSAFAATILFIVSARLFSAGSKDIKQAWDLIFGLDGWGLLLVPVGFVIALLSAALHARHRVHSRKFCETCEMFMTNTDVSRLDFHDTVPVCEHLAAGDIDRLVAALDPDHEFETIVTLFDCPGCAEGFLEVTTEFSASWPSGSGNSQSMSQTWLVASRRLSAPDTAKIRAMIDARPKAT